MAKELKPGDAVAWNSSQGEVKGKVVRKQTSPTKIKGHPVKASPENPEYIVESDKTGARAGPQARGAEEAVGCGPQSVPPFPGGERVRGIVLSPE